MAQIQLRCPSTWFFGLSGIMPLSPHAPLVSWACLLWSSTSFSGFSLYLKKITKGGYGALLDLREPMMKPRGDLGPSISKVTLNSNNPIGEKNNSKDRDK